MADTCLNSDTTPVNPVKDPHPEWLAKWRAARAAVNGVNYDAEKHPMWPIFEDMEKRLLETPASSAAGVAAQLALLAEEEAFGLSEAITQALIRAAATLVASSETACQ